MRRAALRHCGGCHEDAEYGYHSAWPEDWCCALLHAGRRPRMLRQDEPCEECESKNDAERRDAQQQAIYAMERWKPIVMAYELCGTCGTFLGIDATGGGLVVMDTEHDWEWWDYSDWWRAGGPRLHPSRSTRVPVKPKLSLSLAAQQPDASARLEVREVPHEWRSW